MNVLVTGSTGLLGQAVCRQFSRAHVVTGLSRHAPPVPGAGQHVVCDLTNPQRVRQALDAARPQWVIHCQAESNVDRCEQDPSAAWAHNVEATGHLRSVLEALGGELPVLIQLSTDYVFSGTKDAPYAEDDPPDPISVYGRSKAEAERQALAYERAAVVRPSTLFGPGRMNFCDHVLQQLAGGQPVEAFEDQVTSPTYTEELAAALEEFAAAVWASRQDRWPRIVHAVNAGSCSRVAFARKIAQLVGAPPELIRPIPMAAQRRPAARPAHAVLEVKRLPQVIGHALRPWEEALAAYVRTAWQH